MAEAEAGRVSVRCPACGARLGIPGTGIGRRVKCPKCENRFLAEKERATPVRAPAAAPVGRAPSDDDPGALLEGLARDERVTAAAVRPQRSAVTTACPGCGAAMPADARLCVSCGYDVTKGRRHKIARATPSQAASLAKSAGTFVLGCVLSSAGALVGAVVWCVVAVASGFEIGYIAWGVGVLAGLGMYLGYRKQNKKAGVVAAGISLLGILAAKVMIVAVLVLPVYAAPPPEQYEDNFLRFNVRTVMIRNIEWRPVIVPVGGPTVEKSPEDEADGLMRKLSDAQIRDRYRKWRDSYGVCRLATADEGEMALNALAAHRATRSADRMGVHPASYARDTLYIERRAEIEGMTEAEQKEALTKLDAWRKGERWSDAAYCRDYLIYAGIQESRDGKLNRTLDQLLADAEKLPPDEWLKRFTDTGPLVTEEEWEALYKASKTEVDAIPEEERGPRAQAIFAERESKYEKLIAVLEKMPAPKVAVTEDTDDFEYGEFEEESAEETELGLTDIFGLLDIVFVLLALGSAYKIASGGETE